MVDYLELTSQGGITSIVIISLFLLLIAFFVYRKMKRRPKSDEPITESPRSTISVHDKIQPEKKSILNTGNFKCMAIRPGQILDFTTMPWPEGEIYQADTSLPASGGHYIVRELENGAIIDYDPREVPVESRESPEAAWFSVDWRTCKRFWSVPISVWKTPATWFAIALVLVVFIWGLALTGD